MQFEITQELICLGGAASVLVEILRALLLDVEKYPRIKALWKYLPSIFGGLLVLLFPEAVPTVTSALVRMAHGAVSPIAFYVAYPVIRKAIDTQTTQAVNKELGEKKEEP